jgi:N-acetylglucosamine-6-phosphate deacetylase
VRIFASNAVLPTGIDSAYLEVEAGQISNITTGAAARKLSDAADLILDAGYLAPGLIDLQINGAFGTDFMAATESDWFNILNRMTSTGVTAIYPTIITAPVQKLAEWFIENHKYVNSHPDRCAVLGFHLEGPFLSTARKGAHRIDDITNPTKDLIEKLLSAANGSLKIITIAPELPGSTAAISQLLAAGVKVSVGHSDADAATVAQAADLGATLITHLFNAQSPINHRKTGVAGQALIDPRFTLGLIVDLHHVAVETVQLAFQAAADRICLVTDAISALGMPPGQYELAGEAVTVSQSGAPARADGTLAGSALRLDHAISNCIDIGIDPYRAILAATMVPAAAMGLTDRGQLRAGMRADLVWLNSTSSGLEASATWILGKQVFSK